MKHVFSTVEPIRPGYDWQTRIVLSSAFWAAQEFDAARLVAQFRSSVPGGLLAIADTRDGTITREAPSTLLIRIAAVDTLRLSISSIVVFDFVAVAEDGTQKPIAGRWTWPVVPTVTRAIDGELPVADLTFAARHAAVQAVFEWNPPANAVAWDPVIVPGLRGQAVHIVGSESDLSADFGVDGDRAIIRTTGEEWLNSDGAWATTGDQFLGTLLPDTIAARDAARAWAATAENEEVDDGVHPVGYSARHFAAKSEAAKNAAEEAANDERFTAVAAHLDEISTVASSVAPIAVAASSIGAVEAVAQAIDDVNLAADNIALIQAAPGHAEASETARDRAIEAAGQAEDFAVEAIVAKIEWRGAYSAANTYASRDAVSFGGSSWVAKAATTGNEPPALPAMANAWWDLLAAKGGDGTPGAPGGMNGPTGAFIGTSISEQNSTWQGFPADNASSAWFSAGYITWLRALSGQRFNIPLANNFGVGGGTFAGMVERLPDVLAADPDFCIVEGGTNDFSLAGITIATLKSQWLAVVNGLQGAGILPVVMPCIPRGGTVLTAAALGLQTQFNNFVREYALTDGNCLIADPTPYMVDQSSATSTPLPGILDDDVHPTTTGAFWMGYALFEAMKDHYPERPTAILVAADTFHPVNNPTGNLLFSGASNYGLMAGTGGIASPGENLTYASADLAAGWAYGRAPSSDTCTVTLTKENPRTDGPRSGERQIIQIEQAAGGGADAIHSLRCSPSIANIGEWNVYYAEAVVEILEAPENVRGVELLVVEDRPAGSQTLIDMGVNDLAKDGLIPSRAISRLVLRTPPVYRTPDATAIQLNIRARLNSANGAASIKFAVSDVVIRKPPPP